MRGATEGEVAAGLSPVGPVERQIGFDVMRVGRVLRLAVVAFEDRGAGAVHTLVAIAALAMSLIECFLIMPAHLNHSPHKGEAKGLRGKIKALGDFKSSLIEVHLANLFDTDTEADPVQTLTTEFLGQIDS